MKRIIFMFFMSLAISIIFPKEAFGIGQVTKPIVIENALRGQEITETLSFINSKDSEIIYGLMPEGDIAEWTSFYAVDDLDFANPVSEIKIYPSSTQNAIVKFTVPADQPNGTYTGKVYVFDAPENGAVADKNKINIGQRIGRNVSITVSEEEITKLESLIIPLTYVVKSGEPFKIKIIHNNLGNIAVKPSLQIRTTKDGREVFNAIFPYPESEKAVKPLERKIMPLIEWQTTGLNDGQYIFEIKVLLNDKTINRIEHGLTIGPIVRSGNVFLGFVSRIGGGNLSFGWLLFFGGVLLIAIGAIVVFKKIIKKFKIKKTQITLDSEEI